MGIVIMIVMALVAASAFGFNKVARMLQLTKFHIGLIGLIGGIWNAGWYGLQHLSSYWGLMALISGIALMIAGLGLADKLNKKLSPPVKRFVKVMLKPTAVVLVIFAVVYLQAIVRLNLS